MKTLLTLSLAFLCMCAKSQTVKYVLSENTLVYKTPDPYAPIFKTLNSGDTVIISDYNNGYWAMNFKGVKIYAFEPQWALSPPLDVFKSKINIERIKPTSIAIGIFASDVIDIYGEPSKKKTSTGEWGTREQWIYSGPYATVKYVYIENGKVTSWRE
jgi:hypothetical protein